MKGKRVAAICVAAYLVLMQLTASALSTDKGYQYDENEQSIPAPTAYTAEKVYFGSSFNVGTFNNATDLFVDKSQNLYIADSGNSRILIIGANGKLEKEIKSVNSPDGLNNLNSPKGVFKAKDNLIYICDTGNARIVAIDENNNVKRTIKGESMVSVNKNLTFTPERCVVDSDQNVFVISSAVYQGIIRFDRNNEFQSFFAPNQVETTVSELMLSMWKKIFTSEQSDMISKSLPAPYNNAFIDDEDFIYATSANVAEGLEVKKLNAVGDNILKIAGKSGKIFGDYDIVIMDKKAVSNAFNDVQVDDEGVITLSDSNSNKLFQYDNEGNLISIFGGNGIQKGKFKRISAIEKWNGNYVVLDQDKNSITSFVPTPYILKVRTALQKYHNGLYVESEENWKEILSENSNFLIAYRSIGRAELQQGNYKDAMVALKKGNDKYFYSIALKEYRKQVMRENFIVIIIATVSGIAAFLWLCKYIKNKLLK